MSDEHLQIIPYVTPMGNFSVKVLGSGGWVIHDVMVGGSLWKEIPLGLRAMMREACGRFIERQEASLTLAELIDLKDWVESES